MTQHQKAYLDTLSAEQRRCLEACQSAREACEATIQHCLRMGGAHACGDHIRRLQDCADICDTAAGFLLRGSELHAITCGACAEIAAVCAEDCEILGAEDATMLDCAAACRSCAETCRAMSGELNQPKAWTVHHNPGWEQEDRPRVLMRRS